MVAAAGLTFICLISAGFFASVVSVPFQINKCCPENKRLDYELGCVDFSPESEELAADGELPWFPADAIVDAKTMRKSRGNRTREYLSLIKRKYRINYGEMPDCGDRDTRQFALHKTGLLELFNYIAEEDGTLKVHVSKPSSLHDPEVAELFFPDADNDTDAVTGRRLPYDSFRTIPPEDTCVDFGEMSIHFLVFCPCRSLLCIRKCCAEHYHFSAEMSECVRTEEDVHDFRNWRPNLEGEVDNYYLLSDTFPSCDVPILLKYQHAEYSACNRFNKASDNDFTIYPNGSLKVRKYKTLFDPSQYCGEVTISENGTVEEQNLILCSASKKEQDGYEPITHTLYGILLIIGGVCLLLTVMVSLVLPSLRRKVHNKIALSHNVSLMVANFTWAVPQLSTGLAPKSCIVLAFLEQFSLLGSFFWLNVMCIDIAMTFRHLKSGRFDGGTKKFMYYCGYAWGCTALISLATMVAEFDPSPKPDYLKPGFACICGFNTANASILVYLYGPMTVLLLTNLILFIYTTVKIVGIEKQTAMLRKTDSDATGGSSFRSDKERVVLYGKLFTLMGITWIMEIISLAVGGPSYYWYFSDILNLLRAVFIFVLFTCKKQVLKNLQKKWRGESQSYSDKTGSAKSHTDEMALSSSAGQSRKGSNKSECDFQKPRRFKPPVKESSM